MQVTSELLSKFVGGQLEIQNRIEEYIYRGEVSEAVVNGNELHVKFKWVAKGDGLPLPAKWVNEKKTTYDVSLLTSSITEIDSGRIAIQTRFVSNEILVFYPPNGSKLDPAKVEGLALPA